MRALIFILVLVSSPAFAAKGRLLQILEQVPYQPCAEIVKGDFESVEALKPAYSKETAKTIMIAVDMDDPDVISRAREVYTNPQVIEMSGDYLDVASVHRLLAVGVTSISDLASRNRGILNLAIRLKDKTIIGFAQLARTDAAAAFMKGIAKDRSRWFEISYHLDPKYWSKGYGTEIVKALVDEAMANGAEGVYAQTNINNAASGRVLTRAGFNEFERMKFASMGAETGAIHYAVTREDWKKRPSGMEIEHTKDEYGKELMILRVHGQVPTWTVVEVDQKAIDSRQTPLPRLGKDRLVQLTSTSNGNQYLGVYISIPMNPYLSYFTSTLEIDRIFEEALFEGKFDRRFFDIRLTRELTNSRHGSLGYNPSELFPDNFLQLTIFEKRRIYEKLKGVIVMDEKARDIITRKSVIGTGEEN